VVDDDADFLEAVTGALQLQWEDCEVLTAADAESGIHIFQERTPDLVLLDVALKGGLTGFDALKQLRRLSDVPVIMLTVYSAEKDQVQGLELGADDYVVKPFSYATLVARIRAVLRRADLPPPERALPDFSAGDLTVSFQSHSVAKGGAPVKLTPVEYKLLYHLVRNAGRLMPHQALLDRVWGPDYGATADYLKVFISRLRAKVEPGPGGHQYIENERGIGYRFVRPREISATESSS
jgi:two-component system KDP operon response regulator KdpE